MQDEMILNDQNWHDPDVFAQIVNQHTSLVYHIARQNTYSDAEAEDITQEVFIKAWRSIGSFRGDSSLRTWLGRITINTCLDYARKRKKKPSVSLTVLDDEEGSDDTKQIDLMDEDPDKNPATSMEKSENILMVRQAIAALPEEQRMMIVLRDMEGYSYQEISQMLGLELGTVKSRINRARQNIKEYLIKRNFSY